MLIRFINQSSAALGFVEHHVVKTLIFQQSPSKELLCVLMHGDRSVDTKALAQHLNAKKVSAASPESASESTGYQVGGCSPWGQKTKIPIFVAKTISELQQEDGTPEYILINGGARGVLVKIRVDHMLAALDEYTLVDCAQQHKREAKSSN